jgi:hypothetical protein
VNLFVQYGHPPWTGFRKDNPTELNRNLASNLNDLIVRQAEEIADMSCVALHHGEKGLLPGR